VKNATDQCLNCTDFQQRISDFIDEEMPVSERDGFMQHAEACPGCREKLHGCQHVKNLLGRLSSVGVSTDFDVRLKSRIRMEHNFLEDPVYRLKLFVSGNFPRLVAIPAAAAILVTGMLYTYSRYGGVTVDPAELTETPRVSCRIENAPEQSQEEIVSYILESVDESDVETGIFLNDLNGNAGDSGQASSDSEITLVSEFTF